MREHGTSSCYAWGPEPGCLPGRGCRCVLCVDARRQYDKRRRQQAEPAYVSATAVREHLAFLSSQSIGLKTVAQVSGVSHGALWKIVYGVNEGPNRAARAPSRRIRPETAQAILAVMPSAGADGSRIDAGPTWRIVRSLLAAGWTKRAIAHAIGQNGNGLQIGKEQVSRATARRVAALEGQPPPADVGRAWSTHHANHTDIEEPVVPLDDRDRITLILVELLEARIDQRPWRARAACTGKPTWMFFPSRGDHKTVAAAKAVCATCPVQAECLKAHRYEREGIYGGLAPRERRARVVA